MIFTRSSLFAWQSRDEKMRSAPLVTRNSICDVPMLTSHGMVPPFVTLRVSSGFSPGAYAALSVEAETVTRFWLQEGVADGVGVGSGAEADGDAWVEGSADAVAPAPSVDDACSDLPLKAPARA